MHAPKATSVDEGGNMVRQRDARLRYVCCEGPEAIAACSTTGWDSKKKEKIDQFL